MVKENLKKIPHVEFSENIECYSYTPPGYTPPETKTFDYDQTGLRKRPEEIDPSVVGTYGRSKLVYPPELLLELRNCPLSNICPKALNSDDAKKWLKPNLRQPIEQKKQGATNSSATAEKKNKRSVFMSGPQLNTIDDPGQSCSSHNFVPWTGSDPNGQTSINDNNPLQEKYRGNRSQNCQQHYVECNDEPLEDPEWYRNGPTGKDDVVELHGFDESIQHEMNDGRNVKYSESNDSNCGTSQNSSPRAKSTPAKSTFVDVRNSNQRFGTGRCQNWSGSNPKTHTINGEMLLDYMRRNNTDRMHAQNDAFNPHHNIDSNIAFRRMMLQLQSNSNDILTSTLMKNQSYIAARQPSVLQVKAAIDKIITSSNDPQLKRPEVHDYCYKIVDSTIPLSDVTNILSNQNTKPHTRQNISAALLVISQATTNFSQILSTNNQSGSRIPSESELRAHTDAIYQNAILNFRVNEFISGWTKSQSLLAQTKWIQQKLGLCNNNIARNLSALHQYSSQKATGSHAKAGPYNSGENFVRMFDSNQSNIMPNANDASGVENMNATQCNEMLDDTKKVN